MKFMKIKLLVIAVIMFAASSAFASLSYDVTVNTTSLDGQTGYLYFQYTSTANAVASTATVSNFTTDGTLGAQDTTDVANGSAVSGTLPGNVVFANTNTVNDYNHAITFGNSLSFLVTFASTPSSKTPSAISTLSLAIFGDAFGATPLLNTNPANPNDAGTVAAVNLNNDGTTSAQSLDASASATPTPIPAAAWLLGSGLMGLFGMRKKTQV
jgi:hypothetical protein